MTVLLPTLLAYDQRVLGCVDHKARSTAMIVAAVRKARPRLNPRDSGYSESDIKSTLSGLAHLGLIERVAFGRWRKPA